MRRIFLSIDADEVCNTMVESSGNLTSTARFVEVVVVVGLSSGRQTNSGEQFSCIYVYICIDRYTETRERDG